MQILITTPDWESVGGIQTLGRNLTRGLRACGHEVRVLHADETARYRPHNVRPRPRWCLNLKESATARWIFRSTVYDHVRAAIADFDPDFVHALHVLHWPALVAAREAGIRSVLSTHCLELGLQPLAGEAIAAADRVHAVSRYTADQCRAVADCDPVVIPPSIDVDSYRSEPRLPIASPAPVVALSRLVGRKNVTTLVRAWQAATTGERDLIIAGDGPRRDAIERAAGGDPTVKLAGRVGEATKRRLLRRASLFALVPTADGFDAEGFGIVYLEAQASGTAVLGAATGGVPEAVGDAGALVSDPTDVSAVADALETLLADPEQRRRYRRAADERIDQFDREPVARQHAALYRDQPREVVEA